jgi:hypothetical protein
MKQIQPSVAANDLFGGLAAAPMLAQVTAKSATVSTAPMQPLIPTTGAKTAPGLVQNQVSAKQAGQAAAADRYDVFRDLGAELSANASSVFTHAPSSVFPPSSANGSFTSAAMPQSNPFMGQGPMNPVSMQTSPPYGNYAAAPQSVQAPAQAGFNPFMNPRAMPPQAQAYNPFMQAPPLRKCVYIFI